MKPRPSGRGFSLRSVQRARFHMQRAAPSDPKKRAPPPRRDAGVRQTLLRSVVQWRTAPDAGGQVARNDGGSPTSRPPCPEPSAPQPIKPAPMREERSSLVIRNRPCLRWGACRRSACTGMPGPCCLSAGVAPIAALACRESWRGTGCASGFMAATVRLNKFPRHYVPSSRNKFLVPPGPPLRCGRYAVQPARTSPFGSPTRPRWARP